VEIASISEGEDDSFKHPVPDHLGRNVTAPDFRKDRQTALATELLKPKYHAYLPAMPLIANPPSPWIIDSQR